MGTQQILLIVLSVIIVGAAIAVGIQMFNAQSYSANKSAIAADAQSFATQVVQYYKTPESQGGSGGEIPATGAPALVGGFLGFTLGSADASNEWADTDYGISTESGYYWISDTTEGTDGTVQITGIGKEVKGVLHPKIVTTINFPAGTITATASDAELE